MSGRQVESHKEKNSNSLLQVNTSAQIELFPTSTYCVVAASTATTNLRVRERGGLDTGADLYVGTRASAVTVQSGAGTGQGTIVLNTAIAYSQFDSVTLKDVGASTLYASAFSDPKLSTAVSFPVTLDSDNETRLYVEAGQFGRRILNSSGSILEHDHDVDYGTTGITVTPDHNSETAGIQEAANKLPAGVGGVVNIPPGTYTITNGISLPGGCTLRGAGRDLVTIQAAASAAGNFANQINSTVYMLGTDNVSTGVTVEGITFDGNRSNFTGTVQMIFTWRTDDVTIRNNRFQQLSTSEGANARAILINTQSTGNESDVDIYFNEFITIGDSVTNASNCILVANPVDRVRISHNVFDCTAVEARVNYMGAGQNSGDSQDGIAIGNMIRNFETGTALGSVGARGIVFTNFRNLIISGNDIDATEGDMIGADNCQNVTIANNIVKRGREGGIEVSGSKNVSVIGNIANECDGPGISCGRVQNPAVTGLTDITGAANIVISGNITLDNDQSGALGGIFLRSTTNDTTAGVNFVITSNVSGDTRSGASRTQDYGIHIQQNSGNNPTWRNGLIANNKIYNTDADGIRVNDVATCQITDNMVIDCDVFGINVNSSTNVIVKDNRVEGSGTQDLKIQGTSTGSQLEYNRLPTGNQTAMSGVVTISDAGAPGAAATIPPSGTNPYIRTDSVIRVGYSASAGRTAQSPVIATYANGSCVVFVHNATFPGGSTSIFWKNIATSSTA